MPETGVEAKGFNYVTKDGNLLDQKITAGLFTGALGTPEVDLVNGGRSFTLKTISTSGLQPHTRGKGFNSGTVTDEKTIYTMGQDRDVEFYLDRQDVDETNQELAMANISNVFITEQVQPELDSYRFSKIATSFDNVDASDTEGNLLARTHKVEETLDATNAYSQLKSGIGKVRKYGTQNLLGYVSSEVMDSLERSKEFTRNITNQNVGTTALESRITSGSGAIRRAAESAVQKAVAAARRKADINSPSRVMKLEVGQWLAKGIASGIDEYTEDAQKSAQNLIGRVRSTLSGEAGFILDTRSQLSISPNNQLLGLIANISSKLDRKQQIVMELVGSTADVYNQKFGSDISLNERFSK